MKYAITGHSQGIGKYLFEKLTPDVIGFSRSNGYDITKPEIRRQIIKESNDCTIFINSAPAGYSQTELFIDLLKNWKDQEKTIINVGSRIAELNLVTARLDLLEYQSHKLILKNMSLLAKDKFKCSVKYKWFGYVGTEKILSKYPNFTDKDYITVEQAANIILSA